MCAAAIVLLAAVLRFWALDAGLPHPLTRPDEEVVLEMTLRVARGQPLEWGIYPPAYSHFMWAWSAVGLNVAQVLGLAPAGSYADTVRQHPERVLPIARALSALAGTLAVAALMVVTRRELGTSAALAAGVLLATNFLHARDSHAVKPDALLSLEVVIALWAMLPLARRASVRRALLPGLVLGGATATKYPGVLLAGPLYGAALLGSRGTPWWQRLVPLAAVAAGAVAALVFVATSPTVLTDPGTRNTVVFLVRTLLPVGMPGAIVASAPAVSPGAAAEKISPYTGPWWKGFVYHGTFSLRYGAGLLPTLLLPLAVAWGVVSRRPALVLAAVFAVVYYLVVGLSPVNLARYMTPLLPMAALLEAATLAAAAHAVDGWRRGAARVALAVGVMLLAVEPLQSTIAHNRIAARTDTRVLASRWIGEHLSPGTNVQIVGKSLGFYGTLLIPPGITVRSAKPELSALAARGVTHVIVYDHVLPYLRPDESAMEILGPHLRLVAEFDPFTHDRRTALFEWADAYYIPFHGFAGVDRPGPIVRIYALDTAVAGPPSEPPA